jgi:isoamylase
MQDGQNLSDPREAFAATWELDRTLDRLVERGIEPIVVGIHNNGRRRLAEYSPFPDRRNGGGQGDAYLAFITQTVKPRIDRRFRTRRTAADTAVFGSSMGGLISLYASLARPDIFGLAGAMSPSLWFGRDRFFTYAEAARRSPGARIYLDIGTAEGVATVRDARRLLAILEQNGFRRDQSLLYIEDQGGTHDERAWAGRLERALSFLLDR